MQTICEKRLQEPKEEWNIRVRRPYRVTSIAAYNTSWTSVSLVQGYDRLLSMCGYVYAGFVCICISSEPGFLRLHRRLASAGFALALYTTSMLRM